MHIQVPRWSAQPRNTLEDVQAGLPGEPLATSGSLCHPGHHKASVSLVKINT